MPKIAFLIFFFLLISFVSCKPKKQTVYNYQPVFDQTKKTYLKTPSSRGVVLDTIVLIRSNLREEVAIITDTIDHEETFEFCHGELIVPLELINAKPPTYDTFLVAKDYLFQQRFINDLFPMVAEKVRAKYGISDSMANAQPIDFAAETFDTSTTINPSVVYDSILIRKLVAKLPPYLSKEEILADNTRDVFQADSLLTNLLNEVPWRRGDSIPIYNDVSNYYIDSVIYLRFDTVKVEVFDSTKIIPQLPMNKLSKEVCVKVVEKEKYVVFDTVSFWVFHPEEDDIFIDMVRVEGGEFKLGNNEFDEDERPATRVSVSSFLLSKYEMTNKLFCYFLNDIKCDSAGETEGLRIIDLEHPATKIVRNKFTGRFSPIEGYEDHPVVNVTWAAASMFCINAFGRLPSEAEWEYAAKGGKYAVRFYTDLKKDDYDYEFRFAGGNYMGELGWFVDNSYGECHIGGRFRPNELGLYDMCGNVWEWCYDKYDKEYYARGLRSRDPMNLEGPSVRVNRGGSWSSDAQYCRTCNRNFLRQFECNPYLGFRYMRPWK
jgi:formylglycine-generating enzyme required for sulfatase activity